MSTPPLEWPKKQEHRLPPHIKCIKGGANVKGHNMTTTFLSILTTLLLAQLVSPLQNDFCTDPYFEQEWLGKSTTFTLPQIHALQEAGWSALLSSNKPTRAWGVCPCHNAAFTSDDEQWDGIPTQGMQEIRSECYFSLPQCAPYFQTGNCPGASPLSSPPPSTTTTCS